MATTPVTPTARINEARIRVASVRSELPTIDVFRARVSQGFYSLPSYQAPYGRKAYWDARDFMATVFREHLEHVHDLKDLPKDICDRLYTAAVTSTDTSDEAINKFYEKVADVVVCAYNAGSRNG